MRKLWTSVLAFTLLMLMALPVAVQAQATDPLSVFNAYIAAYNKGDVEQAVAYFADTATAKITPAPPSGGSFSGKEQLRAWTQNAANNHNRLEAVGAPQVSGDKVSGIMRLTSDEFKRLGVDFLDNNFEATVANGKIITLNLGATPESLAKLPRPGGAPGSATGGAPSNAPAGAPAAGVGGAATNVSTDNTIVAWLIGLIVCGGLAAFIGVRMAKRRA